MAARAKGEKLIKYWHVYGKKAREEYRTNNADIEENWGGRSNYLGMFEDFYFTFMTDPFMNELFDTNDENSMVSNKEHAKRNGLFHL